MRVRMAGKSDIGRCRKKNQDSMYFNAEEGIAIVADGVGGRKGGEIASSLVTSGLRQMTKQKSVPHEEVAVFLASQIERVNRVIVDKGRQDYNVEGMGSTVNLLWFRHGRLYVCNVGDSRTYLYYKRHFWALTIDHNVKTFVRRGWLSPDSITPGTKDGALVRALGLMEKCEADVQDIKIKTGQIFLTCSDGLYGMVDDTTVAKVISDHQDEIDQIPKILIDLANKAGGEDNITVAISKVEAV